MKKIQLSRFAWLVLAYTLGVIVWGAYVRATGSGAGCGNHWPLCNGSVVPRAPELETLIEFSHRITSGLNLLLILVLAYFVFKTHSKGHLARRAAGFSVLFIFQEALIGAGLVLYGLVTHDQSSARVFSLGLHLGNTFLLTASLAMTAVCSSQEKVKIQILEGVKRVEIWTALLGCLLVGITGSIAALGDTLWPATQAGKASSQMHGLIQGLQQDFSSESPLLLRLRVIHPVMAVIFGCFLLLWVLSQSARTSALQDRSGAGDVENGGILSRQGLAYGVIALVLIQLGVGITNLALLAPVWAQLIHLLLANALWVVLVLYIFRPKYQTNFI